MPRGRIRYVRHGTHHRRCLNCAKVFRSIRCDALTCSPRCRKAFGRFGAITCAADALQARIDRARVQGKLELVRMLESTRGR
jgi:hypothetical protein